MLIEFFLVEGPLERESRTLRYSPSICFPYRLDVYSLKPARYTEWDFENVFEFCFSSDAAASCLHWSCFNIFSRIAVGPYGKQI